MNEVKFYTGYPLTGNEDGEVVAVELLAYDRNKYLTVRLGDSIDEVKTGYVYKIANDGTKKWLSMKELLSLPTNTEEVAPTRKDIHSELKRKRAKKTTYNVWVGNNRSEFNTLKEMLTFVSFCVMNTKEDIVVTKAFKSKQSWENSPIIEINSCDVWDFPEHKRGARSAGVLSKKHFRKLQKLAEHRKQQANGSL